MYFNDGDSFRVLEGEFAGTKARLAGFNTLESFGPVHVWGGWHAKELYFLAKMATYNAQKGVWNCTSDLSQDTYGRTLWVCEDLAIDQIRKGLAHAMTVTDDPSPKAFLDAQKEAIENKRGMWAHGVPEYVLTSLHSKSEGGGSDGKTYNRLVSSSDGHSLKWLHNDNYGECAKICHKVRKLADADVERMVDLLMADAEASELAKRVGKKDLRLRIANHVYAGSVGYMSSKDEANMLDAAIKRLMPTSMTIHEGEDTSCSIYVDFRRRFGGKKAKCLK